MKVTNLVILVLLLVGLLLPDKVDTCGCGGGSSSGKHKRGGDMSSLATLMIVGFMMSQQQARAQQLALGSSLPVVRGEKPDPDQLVEQAKTAKLLSPAAVAGMQLVAKVRGLRQQHGFGFLWGKKRARILKTVAEQINSSRSSVQQPRAAAPLRQPPPPKPSSMTPAAVQPLNRGNRPQPSTISNETRSSNSSSW